MIALILTGTSRKSPARPRTMVGASFAGGPLRTSKRRFKGGGSSREVDDYDTDIGLIFGQNPLMRKYNLADRDRDYAEVVLSASLAETPLSVGMTYFWAEDDFLGI